MKKPDAAKVFGLTTETATAKDVRARAWWNQLSNAQCEEVIAWSNRNGTPQVWIKNGYTPIDYAFIEAPDPSGDFNIGGVRIFPRLRLFF